MAIIYGVDTDKKVNPKDVRDAIVECFILAHSDSLAELEGYSKDLTRTEFEEIKRVNVRQMVRNFFHDVGGDYDNPTRDSILLVMNKLKDFAVNFRDQDTVKKHFAEILELVNKM